jgi:hypothetical protein
VRKFPTICIYQDKANTGMEAGIARPMDADSGPVKMAELYYAIRKELQQNGGDNEKSNYRGGRHRRRRAGGCGRDGGHGPGGAPGPADPARGDGAWTNFTLHLPGKKQNGTIDAWGALLSGAGTFVPIQIPGSDEPVLDVNILGCAFTVVVSGAQHNNHGSYLLFAGDEPGNACAGLNGSGTWSINAAGTIVTARGPVAIFRPEPAPSETTTTETETPSSTATTQPPA